jgi:hypothetical protein
MKEHDDEIVQHRRARTLAQAQRTSANGAHGIYLGQDAHGWRQAGAEQSVMILGPPRSGKTSSFIIPNVLAANGAVVATSTKPDVLDATRNARQELGTVHLFDPTASVADRPGVHRVRWSPLQRCTSWRAAQSTARALVLAGATASGASDHWHERAQALLAPLLHAAALEGADMRTVLTWVDRHQALPAQQILATEPTGADPVARHLLDGITTTDERELSGIWSTTSGALGGFRSAEALEATCRPDFDVDAFVSSSDALYIAAPAHHQALVAPLVVGLLDDVRHATYRWSASARSRSAAPVLLALDELANIAPLPDLPSMISEGGGQGLVTLACFQDLSQARHRWPTQADGFPSLFGTTVVLPGIGDTRTLEALSLVAGEEELQTRSTSVGLSFSDDPLAHLLGRRHAQSGEQLSSVWRRRVPPDLIAHGHPGHGLSFDHRNEATWIPLTPAHRHEPWLALQALDNAHRLVRPTISRDAPGHDLGR